MLSAALGLQTQAQRNTFRLQGTIADRNLDSVSIEYINDSVQFIHETKAVAGGKFQFDGFIDQPCFAYLLFIHKNEKLSRNEREAKRQLTYIQPGHLELTTGAYGILHIKGSPAQEDWNQLQSKVKPIQEALTESTKQEQSIAAISAARQQLHDTYYSFFITHPTSYVTADRVIYFTHAYNLDSLKQLYSAMPPGLQQSIGGRRLAAAIKSREAGLKGTPAFPFSVKDIDGKTLALSDFRGKYVVLDFWATWCAPCRKAMPHMIQLYDRYKDKNLVVIAVGDDDRNIAGWKAAIEKDRTGAFHHVLRGADITLTRKGIPNPRDLVEQYGVHALPTQFLIGPDGIIVGRFEGSNDIDNAIEAALANVIK
jgi:thiol-disulfide isomerase/thioredoxin